MDSVSDTEKCSKWTSGNWSHDAMVSSQMLWLIGYWGGLGSIPLIVINGITLIILHSESYI